MKTAILALMLAMASLSGAAVPPAAASTNSGCLTGDCSA